MSSNRTKTILKLQDTAAALLVVLSYTHQKRAQFNTVVLTQKEVDRVGFAPTFSAMPTYL